MKAQKDLKRWEVNIKASEPVSRYVAYIRAIFRDDKLKHCVIRAYGKAIEVAKQVTE